MKTDIIQIRTGIYQGDSSNIMLLCEPLTLLANKLSSPGKVYECYGKRINKLLRSFLNVFTCKWQTRNTFF